MDKTPLPVPVDLGEFHPTRVWITGVPNGAHLSAGARRDDGAWELAPRDLRGLRIVPPDRSDADIDLAVHLACAEIFNGTVVESLEIRYVHIAVQSALDFVPGLSFV